MQDSAPHPGTEVLALRGIRQSFPKPSGDPLTVLTDVDLTLRGGEILGLLGRSGCGKSTLLRIAAGLVQPTRGEVWYRGAQLRGPAEGIAVVFQTFALFPWLNVLENVETGLDASRLAREEVRRRALAAIDLIGLDGFQSAYPRELSGGMRQRVGFARAIVTEPAALLMDEPFSALDVLTAETLRTDFLDLWSASDHANRAALLVTHNIEEAVLMCDRIIVLASNPGHIAAELTVSLPAPRDRLDAAFRDIVEQIYGILTSRSLAALSAHREQHGAAPQPLPQVSVNRISGFLQKLTSAPFNGHADLPALAARYSLQIDQLFPIAEALHLLEFAEIRGNDLRLTPAGRVYAQADTASRKKLFREHLLRFVPLASHIHRVLLERSERQAPRMRFEAELEDHLTAREAEQTLRVVTAWGRFAELFSYDDKLRRYAI